MPNDRRPAARPGAFRGWRDLAAATFAGVLAGLGQVPFSLWPVALGGLLGVFLLLAGTPGWRRGFLIGWAAGTGYFALTLHWIVEPFLIDIARHGWMAPFALLFAATGFALFWGAAAAIARAAAASPVALALAWTGAMTASELARGYVLTGFPWALPGYIWTETPLLNLAAFTGPYGLTLLTVALPAFAGAAVTRRTPAGIAPAVAACLLALAATGLTRPGTADPAPGDAPVIRLVQPNAAQRDKWDPEKVNAFFRRQLDYTAEPAARRPDLVIWPETAIPWDLAANPLVRDLVAEAGAGVPVAVGFQRYDAGRAYNSLAVVGPGGETGRIYDKHHLVPFGEYVPLGDIAAEFGISGFATRDGNGFSSGPGPEILDLGAVGRALPLICYEAIFPQNLRIPGDRPGWLLQATNDAWFGRIAGPQQHLAQARARAVEQGLPMVRVANTGISAVIDAHGRITASMPLDTAGFVDAALPPALPATFYARTGDGPALVLALFLIGAAAFRRFGNTD